MKRNYERPEHLKSSLILAIISGIGVLGNKLREVTGI